MEEQKKNNIGLIGLGAIGMIAASRFQDMLPERFRVIVDPERQQRLERDGIFYNDRRYDFTFADPSRDGAMDLILIATKASGLSAALDQIAPYVGEHTLILSVLNGITSEEVVAERFGMDKVLYSFFLGRTSMRVGNRINMQGNYHFHFGEKENPAGRLTDRVARVKALFDQAGISYTIPEDMISAMWQKYVVNIGLNQGSVLLRCTYEHMQAAGKARDLTERLMREAVDVARELKVYGAEGMLQRGMEILDQMIPEDKSSMLQDVEAGRQTEVDLFAGELCRLADRFSVDVPLNRVTKEIIEAL